MSIAPDVEVLLERIDVLATHSELDAGRIKRVYLSPEHAAVNALAAEWMTEAGMTTWQDAAGNQNGRLEGARSGLPALVLGSHLDTVPDAGRWDGILGVLAAIAVAKRVHESGARLPFALEVIAFADEEGTRFATALLGSRAFAGTWDDAWWSLTDAGGVTLETAFRRFGLDPEQIGSAARARGDLVGYLEAHIEQGPYLERAGEPLGVVTSIAGARRMIVSITGRAGHAATPYELREDALTGAAEAIGRIETIAQSAGLVATIGHIAVSPDAVNVVAGSAEFSLDLRGEHDTERDAGWERICAALDELCARRRLHWSFRQTHSAPAAWCDDALMAAVAAGISTTAAGAAGAPDAPASSEVMRMFSRAGHDGMAVASLTGFAMLFVRCRGGVSHHPDEHVEPADAASAVDALEAAVLALAGTMS